MKMSDDPAVLAEQVRDARVHLGWTKERAARAAGINSITWKRVEDGLRVRDVSLAAILAVLHDGTPITPAPTKADLRDNNSDLRRFLEIRLKKQRGEPLTAEELELDEALKVERTLANLPDRIAALPVAAQMEVADLVEDLTLTRQTSSEQD